MQPTLLFSRIFPPPPAETFMLCGQDRAGTWLASDTDEPSFMQFICWDSTLCNSLPDIRACLVGQRIPLDQWTTILPAKYAINLHHWQIHTCFTLVFPHPSDPCLQSPKLPLQGSDLPDSAAFLVPIFIKGEQSFLPHQRFNLGALWKHIFDLIL